MPELPDSFRPPYREPEAIPDLAGLEADRIDCTRGLMRHNTTAWRFADDRPLPVVLGDLRQRFTSLGWEDPSRPFGRGSSLKLWHPEGMAFVTLGRVEPVRSDVPPDPDEPPTYELVYVDPMTRAEAGAAAEDLIVEGTPVETLLLLQGAFDEDQMRRALDLVIAAGPPAEDLFSMRYAFTDDQRLRVLDLLGSRGIVETRQRLQMAALQADAGRIDEALEIYREASRELGWPREPLEQFLLAVDLERAGRREDAVEALRGALVLQRATMQPLLIDLIQAEVNRLGIDPWSLVDGIDEETPRGLGFVEIRPDAIPPARTVSPGDLLLFFAMPAVGGPRTFSLRVTPDGDRVAWVEQQDGSGSGSSDSPGRDGSIVRDWSARDDLLVRFRLDPEEEHGHFRLSVEVEPLLGDPVTPAGP